MVDQGSVLLGLLIAVSACGLCAFTVCCACCCLSSMWNAFYNVFLKSGEKIQTINYSKSSIQTSTVPYATSASYSTSQDDVPMVEAYVLPPLAAAQAGASLHSVPVENTRPTPTYGAKDIWAAILFLINVIIIFALAAKGVNTFYQSNTTEYDYGDINFPMVTTYLLISLFSISILGSSMIYFFIHHGGKIIEWVMTINIVALIIMATLCLITFNIIGAVVFGICAGLNTWYYYSVKNRIPFASSVLSAACSAVKENFFGLILTSLTGLLFQGLWMLLWSIAIFGTVLQTTKSTNSTDNTSTDDKNDWSDSLSNFVIFLFLLSLYWGLQCIKDVVSVTSGGTVASWWFQPHHPAPVRAALFRATTTSFGSICFGSLILAFITTLRAMVRGAIDKMRNDRNRNFVKECLLLILSSILNCLENLIAYINRYAYAYIAAYGYDFMTAGKYVMSLFEQRGWSAIINDDLISNALTLLAVFMSLLGGLVGLILTGFFLVTDTHSITGAIKDQSTLYIIGGIYGGLVGLVVGLLIVSVIDSAVAMVYVCFAEDPMTLQVHHPETYHDLQEKWLLFNPDNLLTPTVDEGGNYSQYHLYQQQQQQQQQSGAYHYPPSADHAHHHHQNQHAYGYTPKQQQPQQQVGAYQYSPLTADYHNNGYSVSQQARPPSYNPHYQQNNNNKW
jgi:hypothetical protein